MAPWLALLLVAAVNFLSALIQASTGFGYALVAMALMALFLPMSTCSAISAVTVVVIGLQMSLTLRRHLRFRTIRLPVLCCLATINVGLFLLDRFPELLLRVILASLLLVVTGLFFFLRRKRIRLPGRWYCAAGVGFITGVSTGMFNIVGPFLMIYYMNVCDDTLHLKASLEFSFLIAGLYSAAMHLFVYRNITPAVLPYLMAAALAALLAGRLGLRIYRRIDRDKIALTVYLLLPLMAGALIWNGL